MLSILLLNSTPVRSIFPCDIKNNVQRRCGSMA